MENEKILPNAEQYREEKESEIKNFNHFIGAMVTLVEKYGKSVLQDLDCVA